MMEAEMERCSYKPRNSNYCPNHRSWERGMKPILWRASRRSQPCPLPDFRFLTS